jgi:hypothetical protein
MSNTMFFDNVIQLGQEFLGQLRGRADAGPFLRRLRDVYLLMIDIHDDILNATIEVGTVGNSR